LLPLDQLDVLLVYMTKIALVICNAGNGARRTDLVLHRPLGLDMIFLQLLAKFFKSFQVFNRNPHFLDFLCITYSNHDFFRSQDDCYLSQHEGSFGELHDHLLCIKCII